MLENIFLIILITILAFFFLFFLFWLFFIRREFQFLKDHIKIRKEIENIQDEEREKRIFSLLNPDDALLISVLFFIGLGVNSLSPNNASFNT